MKTAIITDVERYFFMANLFTVEVIYKYSIPAVF
jgi:hypothetical protein